MLLLTPDTMKPSHASPRAWKKLPSTVGHLICTGWTIYYQTSVYVRYWSSTHLRYNEFCWVMSELHVFGIKII